jgi:hypothetical protein
VFNKVERQTHTNISASTAAFTLRGGTYGVTANATWGGGTAKLQKLAADDTTYVSVATAADFAADGYTSINLPSGTYRWTIATATAIYLDITSIVTAM